MSASPGGKERSGSVTNGEQDGAEPRAAHWLVSGRVQGVGFRWYVSMAAERHQLGGDVRNLPDGRVEIRTRGPERDVRLLWEEVKRGPGSSRVDHVEELVPDPTLCFDGFRIR